MGSVGRKAFRNRSSIRRKRATPRRGPLRSDEYREWLRERACVACVKLRDQATLWGKLPPALPVRIEAAHTENGGMSMKGPDSGCVPLCAGIGSPDHHGQYDGRVKLPDGSVGKKAFERFYGIDMRREAAIHWKAFRIIQEGTNVSLVDDSVSTSGG